MRYIITEIKNTPEGINRLCDTEEWTCNLEDRVVEIIEDKQEKGKKKKKMKIKEENLQDFQYKSSTLRFIFCGAEEEKQKESIFEEMIAETFPNLRK